MKKIIKNVLTILAIVGVIVGIGLVGSFDQDEYIEVNLASGGIEHEN